MPANDRISPKTFSVNVIWKVHMETNIYAYIYFLLFNSLAHARAHVFFMINPIPCALIKSAAHVCRNQQRLHYLRNTRNGAPRGPCVLSQIVLSVCLHARWGITLAASPLFLPGRNFPHATCSISSLQIALRSVSGITYTYIRIHAVHARCSSRALAFR